MSREDCPRTEIVIGVLGTLVLFLLLVVLVGGTLLAERVERLEGLVGTPSRNHYAAEGYTLGPNEEEMVQNPDGTRRYRQPSLWQVADSQYEDLIHLRPLRKVPGETLIQLADVDGFEMKLLGENTFWDWYRLTWMLDDLDQDGIPNREDACPDIPAPGDPIPIYLKPFKDQLAWFSANYDFVENNLTPDDLVYNPYRRRSSFSGGWYEIPGSNNPPPAERHNLYYGCPEECDDDHDGVACYRDMCPGTVVTTDDPIIDHHVVRGPRSLFPRDQGCTKSQLAHP